MAQASPSSTPSARPTARQTVTDATPSPSTRPRGENLAQDAEPTRPNAHAHSQADLSLIQQAQLLDGVDAIEDDGDRMAAAVQQITDTAVTISSNSSETDSRAFLTDCFDFVETYSVQLSDLYESGEYSRAISFGCCTIDVVNTAEPHLKFATADFRASVYHYLNLAYIVKHRAYDALNVSNPNEDRDIQRLLDSSEKAIKTAPKHSDPRLAAIMKSQLENIKILSMNCLLSHIVHKVNQTLKQLATQNATEPSSATASRCKSTSKRKKGKKKKVRKKATKAKKASPISRLKKHYRARFIRQMHQFGMTGCKGARDLMADVDQVFTDAHAALQAQQAMRQAQASAAKSTVPSRSDV
mgnify:CR=1 FL=1